MSSDLHCAHDKFFKLSMQQQSVAKDFFRHHLPQSLQAKIDWDSLRLQRQSYIDTEFQDHQADVLYRMKVSKQDAYIYVLSEHQSTPDELMPFRLWNYMCQIWKDYLKKQKKQQKQTKKLPLIYPLVFYHGKKSPYKYSMNFIDCFNDAQFAKQTYYQAFHLVDVAMFDDEELVEHGYAAIMELLQKHIFVRDISKIINYLAESGVIELLGTFGDSQYLYEVLKYVLEKGQARSKESVLQPIKAALQNKEAVMANMTVAQILRQEGRQEGRKAGIEHVEKIAKFKIARSLLAKRQSLKAVAEITDLPIEVVKKLRSQSE